MSASDDSGVSMAPVTSSVTEKLADTPIDQEKSEDVEKAISPPDQPGEEGLEGPNALQNDQGVQPMLATNESSENKLCDDLNTTNDQVQPSDPDDDKLDDISDGDSVDEHMEAIRNRYANLEQRILLAPKRLRQQNQYTKILEERISMLEERVALFDRKLQKPGVVVLPPTLPAGPALPTSTLKPILNFKFWQEFKNNTVPPEHIIDVLIGEPEIPRTEKARRRKTLGNSMPSDTTETMTSSEFLPVADTEKRVLVDEVAALKGNHLPERIRFNSIAIPRLFCKFFRNNNAIIPDNIMLYPFKPLLQNFEEIRELMADITGAVSNIIRKRTESKPDEVIETPKIETPKVVLTENKDDPKEPDTPDSIHADEWERILKDLDLFHCTECTKTFVSDWPTKSALESSLNCIRDLLDNYLLPVHLKFRKQQVAKVHFRELWHLFQTGDLIVTKPSKSQKNTDTASTLAMRILVSTGGRRVISPAMSPPIYGVALSPPMPGVAPKEIITPETTEDTPVAINGNNPFCIQAYYLDFDGYRLVPVRRRFVIPPYIGERNVKDFEVYPMTYTSTIKQKIENRGKRFVELVTASTAPYVNCVGLDLETREELNDKVIVDMKGYFNTSDFDRPVFTAPGPMNLSETNDCPLGNECIFAGGSGCPHGCTKIIVDQASDMAAYNDYIDLNPQYNFLWHTRETEPKTPDHIICHYRVFAYKLRSREWVQVNVDGLEASAETETNQGFELLVLPKDHKQILESQVREHFRKRGLQGHNGRKEDDMDLVRGKGQGLIILLHGAPGVGKTCTAECIAELVKKPLYPITCGDLGSTAEDVERNLKKHFTLASNWDCVMLLDEADVFLARRKSEDLHRNSIVSVFLRMLEYYKGLLFLTTNRVGSFDEAFKSRVHISLFYPNFDKSTTIKVWKTFIKQATRKLKNEGRKNVNVDAKEIKRFAKEHWEQNPKARWNGRQIRNAFRTAVAMAEFHARENEDTGDQDANKDVKIKIGREQFDKIAKTAKEFDDYMAETMGGTYDLKASKAAMRREEVEKEAEKKADRKRDKENGKRGKKAGKASKKRKEETTDTEGSSNTGDSESEDDSDETD